MSGCFERQHDGSYSTSVTAVHRFFEQPTPSAATDVVGHASLIVREPPSKKVLVVCEPPAQWPNANIAVEA